MEGIILDKFFRKNSETAQDDMPGVIEVINGTTVFCEFDHADIVIQAGPETFAEGKKADFFYAKQQGGDSKKKNPTRPS